jgi:hypothetical protein
LCRLHPVEIRPLLLYYMDLIVNNGGNRQSETFRHMELCGAIHLHTTFSDGGVSYPQLIEAAKTVGLDYVVVTDHGSLAGKEAGHEGFSGGLFVCVGYEHNDANNINHYLAMGCNSVVKYSNDPQGYIDRIKEAGGIGFIAHPIERRHYFEKYPPYPWTAWDAVRFDGIELWNQMSDWLENLRSCFNVIRLFYPRRFLLEIRKELLEKWDTMNMLCFVSGIGGVDAHTMKMRIGPFRIVIFPIKVELKGIRTHVFIEEPLPANDTAHAKAVLLDALKKGHGFISNFRRGDAKGTKIFLQDNGGACFPPGLPDRELSLPARMSVFLPGAAEVRLVRNGVCVDRRMGSSAEFRITGPGLFRIEVYKGKYAWIYSNPFPVGSYPLP